MKGIKILIEEHENILRMLDIVRAVSLKILEGGEIDTKDFKKMVDFIRIYADKNHHGKEEEFLFKAMENDLGNAGKNLIRGMLIEHDLGRLYVSDLDTAVDEYWQKHCNEAKLDILVAAGSYEKLLRRHIQKENDVVFTFGEKKLSEEALLLVEVQTRDFEENHENSTEKMRQISVLEELEKKYI